MGVGDRYVGDALRLQREDPAAFAQVRAGKTSLNAALTRLLTASGAAAKQAARARDCRARTHITNQASHHGHGVAGQAAESDRGGGVMPAWGLRPGPPRFGRVAGASRSRLPDRPVTP